MMEQTTIRPNKDNDLKFMTGLAKTQKPLSNNSGLEKEQNESVENNNGDLEYFSE